MVIFDAEGKLQLRTGGQVKVARKYRNFYINKLQAENSTSYPRVAKTAESNLETALHTRPTLSAKTLKYAENRKNKLKTEGCDIVEHLLRKNTVM